MNVGGRAHRRGRLGAGTLAELSPEATPQDALARIGGPLVRDAVAFDRDGFAPRRPTMRGATCCAAARSRASSAAQSEGVTAGVDGDGALKVTGHRPDTPHRQRRSERAARGSGLMRRACVAVRGREALEAMLRALVLLLVLVNAGRWFWLQGNRQVLQSDREPQRLQRQVAPDAIQVLPDLPHIGTRGIQGAASASASGARSTASAGRAPPTWAWPARRSPAPPPAWPGPSN